MIKLPFSLAYLDWCKEHKQVKDIKETERRDWIIEFYHSDEWKEEPISGFDIALALGENI